MPVKLNLEKNFKPEEQKLPWIFDENTLGIQFQTKMDQICAMYEEVDHIATTQEIELEYQNLQNILLESADGLISKRKEFRWSKPVDSQETKLVCQQLKNEWKDLKKDSLSNLEYNEKKEEIWTTRQSLLQHERIDKQIKLEKLAYSLSKPSDKNMHKLYKIIKGEKQSPSEHFLLKNEKGEYLITDESVVSELGTTWQTFIMTDNNGHELQT